MEDSVKVSVLCIVYNHEKCLEKCLESLINQKTNFKYEIIIHDDVSKDGSRKIIEKYYEKYPDLIVPILETENQFSKGVDFVETYMLPKSRGKYITYCEGDDQWCDENKLQKQYDYMEKDPDCFMCTHNTVIHDLTKKHEDKLFNNWNEIHVLTEDEVFLDWKVHTTSFFYRKCSLPEFAKKYFYLGDYVDLTLSYARGKVVSLPDTMSIYNICNENGLLKSMDDDEHIEYAQDRLVYLTEYNEWSNGKYSNYITKRIKFLKIEILKIKINYVKNEQEYKEIRDKLYEDKEVLTEFINTLSFKDKEVFKIKLKSYLALKTINKVKKTVK